ncbi:MAG: homoserine dehydrogenase [Planctomycetes bacterium]|nr:homoserine dehydrogenase [Planctomycetota bacterium]
MQTTGVAVIGFGTVGTGVVGLLLEDGDRLAHAAGCRLVLRRVCDVDLDRPRDVSVPADLLTTRAEDCLNDPDVQVIVETVGGTTFAVDLMKQALAAGKHVVTANKAALAERGPELFRAAHAAGRSISFEASCAAGIPIIRAIRDGLIANRISGLTAILNGTCNYILTRMSSTGAAYGDALAEAQAKGYAEADPTLDVSGEDARHKLAILGALAFGTHVDLANVYVEGIRGISPQDITFGAQLGYVLKLLAIGRFQDGGLSLRVHPTFIPAENPLATVTGADNAVLLTGHAVGDTFYEGPGAGRMPTASSIVADLVDVALGRAQLTFQHIAWLAGRSPSVAMQPIAGVRSRTYLRFDVADETGVLAAVAGALGRHDISVASVLQREPTRPDSVPLVITTHEAREGNVADALAEIQNLPFMNCPAVRIRMLDRHHEDAP